MRIRQHISNINGTWDIDEPMSLVGKVGKGVILGMSSSVIVVENTKRRGLIIVNGSTGTVTLGFGHEPTLYAGATLYPGGVFNMNEFDFYTGTIYGISSEDDSLVMVQEFE